VIRILTAVASFTLMALLLIASVIEAVRNLGYLWKLWHWAFLFSPAFYVYCFANVNVLWFPMAASFLLAGVVRGMRVSRLRGIGLTAAIIGGVILANYAFQALAWGSLPITYDHSGDAYIRLIPFIPWPDRPFHW
jgi:hypothetical protein